MSQSQQPQTIDPPNLAPLVQGAILVRPLVEELLSWDPLWVCQRLAHLPGLLFLDSAASHPGFGRYSFVTADPFLWLESRGPRLRFGMPTGGGEWRFREECGD